MTKPKHDRHCVPVELPDDKPVPGFLSGPAHSFYMQSLEAKKRGDNECARRLLEAGLTIGPDHPGPWYTLGVELYGEHKYEAACAAMGRALSLLPDQVHALTNMGIYLYHAGRYEEAAAHLRRAVEIAPDKALGWSNLCLVETALGNLTAAAAAGRYVLELEPKNDSFRIALSFTEAHANRTAEGLALYESRFGFKLPELLALPCPKWKGERGSSIFVTAEQGLGDTLQFARFLPLVIDRFKRVVFGCQQELVAIMAAAFPSLEIYPMPTQVPETEFHTPLMSIPGALGLSDEEIFAVPADYLTRRLPKQWSRSARQNTAPARKWNKPLADMPGVTRRIGICWAGNPAQENDGHRSATVEDFLPLAELPGVQLYSLQVGKRRHDIDQYSGLVQPLSAGFRGFEDTFEAVSQLDHVVTVCTSVVHLAGAVGTTPTTVLVPRHGAHWIWGSGETTRWYPNVRIARQPTVRDWRTPMQQVKAWLSNP